MSDHDDAAHHPGTNPAAKADLRSALREGDPQRVRALIEAGADVRYRSEHHYDALIDAVHGRDVARDPRLLELLALLVAHGVNVSGVSGYGESALRVLSRVGRFDAVQLLLDAGADKGHLEWTSLMEAVALGSLADVEAALADAPALEARDWWSRTAWLIALLAGDIAKAELLLARGADPAARGRCGCPPPFYPIRGHHPEMLRRLIRRGADVDTTDEFGTTPLMEAVENDDLECVNVLLAAGADVSADANGTALRRAESRGIILRLLDAGADPADLGDGGQRAVLGLAPVSGESGEALAAIPPDEFLRTFGRTFGASNPQRMRVPLWEAMIRSGVGAYEARRRFEERCGPVNEPVWCAQRFGQSLTLLPDGRALQIGGEHEDHYDPDFCIYNDVFVHEPDGSVAIYGYPRDVFPPTDFHTATPVGDFLYVIGSLGYHGTRQFGRTPVYRLDLRTLRIERLEAGGEGPGWIYSHRAAAAGTREIRVWGGKVAAASDGKGSHAANGGTFILDLNRLQWRA